MTQWTPQQRAEAVGLAVAMGSKAAAKATGIPRRTISAWLAAERRPELQAIVVENRGAISERLQRAVDVGLSTITEGMAAPNARLGDVARAYDVVSRQRGYLDPVGPASGPCDKVHVYDLPEEEQAGLRDAIDRELRLRGIGDDDRAMAAARAAYVAALYDDPGAASLVDAVVGLLAVLTPGEAAELDARLTPRLLTEGTPTWD